MRRSFVDKGFTLIEIMVVLAIVGLLLAVALPSYGDYQRRAIAREGALALMGLATLQERSRLASGQYLDTQALLAERGLPPRVADHFDLLVNTNTSSGYWLMQLLPHASASGYEPIAIDSHGRRSPRKLWP